MPLPLLKQASSAGSAAAGLAYLILGASSLFWRMLSDVPAPVLLGYRILTSLVALGCTVLLLSRGRALGHFAARPRLLALHLAGAALVSVNWITFIWGSIHGHVLETGVGYLLSPAVSIVTGAVVLRERLDRTRICALALCLAGLLLLVARSVELQTWVYLTIGFSWGLYGFLKKLTVADPVSGLTLETAMLALAVTAAAVFTPYSLAVPTSLSGTGLALLASCGVVSVIPLWLLSYSAQKISLTTAGFLQYVLPSTQFVVAIAFYEQRPTGNTIACFLLIWSALVMVAGQSALRRLRTRRTNAGSRLPAKKGAMR